MSYGFNRFFLGRRFVKLLLERKLMNAMHGRVLHAADSTEEALEVHEPGSKDGSIVSEEVQSIRIA